jgi:DNA-binding GntR family transcriptional regulator
MTTEVNTPIGRPAEISRAEQAYLVVRDLILSLRLEPGAPIHEETLGKELDLGRTPLREAIKRLEAESLIAIYPRRGTFVTEVNITDHALIADVRRRLEGHAARRAAERVTHADRNDLLALHNAVQDLTGTQTQIMELDTQVHRAVYRCTHNKYLESTLGQYYNLALRIWCLFFDRLPDVTDHITEHSALLNAIVVGDADLADRIAVEHVDHFEHAIRAVV